MRLGPEEGEQQADSRARVFPHTESVLVVMKVQGTTGQEQAIQFPGFFFSLLCPLFIVWSFICYAGVRGGVHTLVTLPFYHAGFK